MSKLQTRLLSYDEALRWSYLCVGFDIFLRTSFATFFAQKLCDFFCCLICLRIFNQQFYCEKKIALIFNDFVRKWFILSVLFGSKQTANNKG